MLPIGSFFIVFALIVQMTKFNPTKLFVCQYVLDLESYFRHCLIIKCVSLEPIIFAINMDTMSSSKIFNRLCVFIDCITNLNQ